MILTRRLLVDIFLTRSLSKSIAFCEFASVNFEPWGGIKKHLRIGPAGNSEFCFPSTTEGARGTKLWHCFPWDQSSDRCIPEKPP